MIFWYLLSFLTFSPFTCFLLLDVTIVCSNFAGLSPHHATSDILEWRSKTRINLPWPLAGWLLSGLPTKQGNNRSPEQCAGCRSVGAHLDSPRRYVLFPFWLLTPAWWAAHSHSSPSARERTRKEKTFCRRLVLICRLECLCDNVARFAGNEKSWGELWCAHFPILGTLRCQGCQSMCAYVCQSVFLCRFMSLSTDRLSGYARKQLLNEGIIVLVNCNATQACCTPAVGWAPFALALANSHFSL